MANFAGQEAPTVGLANAATPYAQDTSTPQAFGVGLGQAVSQVAGQAGDIAAKERLLNASFSAADQELKSGKQLDVALRTYKDKLRNGSPAEGESYEDFVGRQIIEFSQEADKIHFDGMSALRDPIAQKNFAIRMRLQTQAYDRHVSATADAQIVSYRTVSGQAVKDRVLQQSGNATYNPEQDIASLRGLALTLKPYEDSLLHAQQLPPDIVRREMAATERGMVEQLLKSYAEKGDFKGGKAILDGQFHDGLKIGFDPSSKSEAVLNGTTTEAWRNKFAEIAAGQNQVDRETGAAALAFSWHDQHIRDPDEAAAKYRRDGGDPRVAEMALNKYTSMTQHAKQRQEVEIGNTYEQLYKTIDQRYGRDLDAALKDPTVQRMWIAIGPKQEDLRRFFEGAGAGAGAGKTPEMYAALGRVIDLSAIPGALSKKYPTAGAFMAEFHGATGDLYPQALHMYEADVKRDTSQDVHYQIFKSDIDNRARNVTGYTHNGDPTRNYWDGADPESQAVHTWMVLSAEQAWAEHSQARRETPGKVSDVTWYNTTLSDLSRQAETLKKRGAFKRGAMPDVAAPPAAATTIPVALSRPRNEAEYNLLRPGAQYIDPKDNRVHTKE